MKTHVSGTKQSTKSNKQSNDVIVSFFPDVYAHAFNITDIGLNKPYVDTGKTAHEIANQIQLHIPLLQKLILANSSYTFHMVIPGFVFSLLAEHDEDAFSVLKNCIDEHNISVMNMPYFGSTINVLSSAELYRQIQMHKKAVHSYVGKKSRTVFSFESIDKKQYPFLARTKIISPSKQYPVLSLTDIEKITATQGISDFALKTSPFTVASSHESLQLHIKEELQGLYTHIYQTQDANLLSSWAYLSNPTLLQTVSGTKDISASYDAYAQYMMVCNDIVHKLRSVSLSMQGDFLSLPEIFEFPSKSIVLDEVFE